MPSLAQSRSLLLHFAIASRVSSIFRLPSIIVCLAFGHLPVQTTLADDAQADDYFENHVRPVLVEKCLKCHGPQKSESSLRLDQWKFIEQGGDSGPAIVPGDAQSSLLLRAIRHEDGLAMPPKEKLDAQQIAALEQWIQSGAHWPAGVQLAANVASLRSGPILESEKAFWSLQPIRDPQPPMVETSQRIRNDIDRFVIARLQADGLQMRAPADNRTLLRRATFDLTGLPPTAAELDAFLQDDSDDAFAKVVERLLASKAYGERWGRHWLDVVRYADTAGETADYPTPLAYKYRNWVINALNADMPYDEFIRQQIAGDILGAEMVAKSPDASSPDTVQAYRDQMTATGFIAISRRFGFDVENYHYLTIQDTIDTVGQSILGLTLGCARCHDHKFDPVNMTDYYAWYGIFESTRYSFPGSEEKKRPYDSFPSLPPTIVAQRQAELDQSIAKIAEVIRQLEADKAGLESAMSDVFGPSGFHGWENEALDQPPSKPWGHVATARIVSTAQSPFENAFPRGSRGITFPSDEANNAFERTLPAVHNAENTPLLHYNADFRNTGIAPGASGSYRFYMGHGPGHSAAVEIAVSQSQLMVKNGANYETVCEVQSGTWYNLQVTADLKARVYSGRLTSESGQVVAFENKAFTVGWDGTIDYTFVDKFGPGQGATPSRDIDNVLIDTRPILAANQRLENADQLAARLAQLQPTIQSVAEKRQAIAAESAKLEAVKRQGVLPQEELIYGAIERDTPVDAAIQLRGEKTRLGEVVLRRNLEILGGDSIASAGSGRKELADWLTRSDNPLTARVMVNRIWQQHFGRGIVATENDFGMRGQRPTHPELLDWLASRFQQSGWSIKAMHRLIMASATYQQASDYDHQAAQLDPDAKLLWRFNRRRLSAEEIRDAMMSVSQTLDPKMGDQHPFPPVDSWGYSQHSPYYGVYPSNLRSVYLMQQRLKRHPFLGLFDGPDANVSTARREPTTVPTQALFLMNNELVHESANSLVKRIIANPKYAAWDRSDTTDTEAFDVTRGIANELVMTILGRPASEAELLDAVHFVADYEKAMRESTPTITAAEGRLSSLAAFARTLLVCNEFLFVD